jgi:hypothetical protein
MPAMNNDERIISLLEDLLRGSVLPHAKTCFRS